MGRTTSTADATRHLPEAMAIGRTEDGAFLGHQPLEATVSVPDHGTLTAVTTVERKLTLRRVKK